METSGTVDGVGGQKAPSMTRSLRSSAARYVMTYSRPSEPLPRTSS